MIRFRDRVCGRVHAYQRQRAVFLIDRKMAAASEIGFSFSERCRFLSIMPSSIDTNVFHFNSYFICPIYAPRIYVDVTVFSNASRRHIGRQSDRCHGAVDNGRSNSVWSHRRPDVIDDLFSGIVPPIEGTSTVPLRHTDDAGGSVERRCRTVAKPSSSYHIQLRGRLADG